MGTIFDQSATPNTLPTGEPSEAALAAAHLTMADVWLLSLLLSYLSARGIPTASLTAVGVWVRSYDPPPLLPVGADVAIR